MKDKRTGKYINAYGKLKLDPRPLAVRLPQLLNEVLIRVAKAQSCDLAHIMRQALAQKFFLDDELTTVQIWALLDAGLLDEDVKDKITLLKVVDSLIDEL